ncbi:MAG: glycosyltransferase family 4 protein [Zavarzinella sp.]
MPEPYLLVTEGVSLASQDQHARTWAVRLAEMGHQVHLICRTNQADQVLIPATISVHRTSSGMLGIPTLVKILRKLPPDAPAMVFGYRAARDFRLATMGKPRRWLAVLDHAIPHHAFNRWVLQSAERIITPARWEGITVPQTVCPPAVDCPPKVVHFRQKLEISPHPTVLLTVGHWDGLHDAYDVVWAYELLRYGNPTLIPVYAGNGPARGEIEALTRAMGDEDYRARFLDGPTIGESLMADADIVAVTRRSKDGLRTIAEAMWAGKAVIAYDHPGVRLLVRDGENGFIISVGDIPAYARKLHLLATQPSLRQQLGQQARVDIRLLQRTWNPFLQPSAPKSETTTDSISLMKDFS